MRSPRVSQTRPCTLRRSTTRCYLSAAFSASSRFFDLKSAANRFKARRISPIIAASLRRFSHRFNADEVFRYTRENNREAQGEIYSPQRRPSFA
jgi:hypothetical protein